MKFYSLTWSVLDLEERSPYICQFPQKKIGCLTEGDNGADYNGTASKTWTGQHCLRWDTEGAEQLYSDQKSWAHNYCRNPEGADDLPHCLTDGGIDYCALPKCENRPVSI